MKSHAGLKIQINNEDNTIGQRHSRWTRSSTCPLVRAVKRATGSTLVFASSRGVTIDGIVYGLPESAAQFIRTADTGGYAQTSGAFIRDGELRKPASALGCLTFRIGKVLSPLNVGILK